MTSFTPGTLMSAEKIKVLITDGPQKAHNYKDTTPVLMQLLGKTARFEVDHSRSTKKGCEDGTYKPDFSLYDVVVMNEGFGAADWPEATQKAFEKYMANGGGMVSFHAANNCWPNWKEYNKMTGIGGWGKRNESSGPYLYIDSEGAVVRDTSKGKGGSHGPQHEFKLIVREKEHPIMKGLPPTFVHGPDELYDRLRGPAENVTILATAFSSKKQRGTDRNEPTLMTITYGKGRIFHTVLGHGVKQIKQGSFVTTFLRGTEWAATGKVSIPVPKDFPNQKVE
ncbi:ThuA domain-containing protein [Verrucomicrobiaceae bacterium N1E253]|uniref:ThuA domain-containing protein n=2 Tax=Oceaniferula marina TaxID=2748318 RepID=A0A851GF04_9BACT|nr:ThuA domain-containing protein [Oceaniferula marina]